MKRTFLYLFVNAFFFLTPLFAQSATEPVPSLEPSAQLTIEVPTFTPEASSLPLESPTPVVQQVQEIAFIHEDSAAPAIRITLTRRSPFTFSKEKEREYILHIPDCGLANQGMTLPQFPTNDMVGFSLVRAASNEKGVDISILTDDGMRATAVMKENSIIIKGNAGGF